MQQPFLVLSCQVVVVIIVVLLAVEFNLVVVVDVLVFVVF